MNNIKNKKPRRYINSYVAYNTKNMTHEEWLTKRREGIGGSDVSKILGINPHQGVISVYMDKLNIEDVNEKSNNKSTSENDFSGNDNNKDDEINDKNYKMYLGNKLEDFVAREFSKKTGKKVRRLNGILKNKKYPYSLANLDRVIIGEKAFLECVVTNSYSKKYWTHDIPDVYKVQCYHYLAITEAPYCYVCALISNEELIIHKLNYDEKIINDIMKKEQDFYERYILGEEIPFEDGCVDYDKYLSDKYKNTKPEVLMIFEKEEIINNYDDICIKLSDLEKEKKKIEQHFKNQMEDYEVAYVGDRRITYKFRERNTIDTKRLKTDFKDVINDYMNVSKSRVFKMG